MTLREAETTQMQVSGMHGPMEPPSSTGAGAGDRAQELACWRLHLSAFLIVNAVLFIQGGFQPGAGHFWGWGLGLVLHGVSVFRSPTAVQAKRARTDLE